LESSMVQYYDWNQFVGTIPTEFGILTNVTQLYFHDNRLTGRYGTVAFRLSLAFFRAIGVPVAYCCCCC